MTCILQKMIDPLQRAVAKSRCQIENWDYEDQDSEADSELSFIGSP